MTITYPISFSLNLDDERQREREREESENKMQHIILSFKTFADYNFQVIWLLLVISPQNEGYRIKIYETQNTTHTSYNIPNHSYRNICIISSGILQTQLISHQYCTHTKTTSNKIQLHWKCFEIILIIS
jgi:hypothetical protein